MCASTFDGDPEHYSKASDLASGKEADKATALVLGYGGNTYLFESKTTKTAFTREPDRHAR